MQLPPVSVSTNAYSNWDRHAYTTPGNTHAQTPTLLQVEAKTKEIDTETHLKALSEREMVRGSA